MSLFLKLNKLDTDHVELEWLCKYLYLQYYSFDSRHHDNISHIKRALGEGLGTLGQAKIVA